MTIQETKTKKFYLATKGFSISLDNKKALAPIKVAKGDIVHVIDHKVVEIDGVESIESATVSIIPKDGSKPIKGKILASKKNYPIEG